MAKSKRLLNKKRTRSIALAGAALAGIAGWFFWQRKRSDLSVLDANGVKLGPDPAEINLKARYGSKRDRDVIDEASWESFPASDPPAY